MANWNIKASTLFILSSLVFLMLLIVVLPDVDLPDTAFHRGTAPIVVHTQGTSAPAAVTVAYVFQFPDPAEASDILTRIGKVQRFPRPQFSSHPASFYSLLIRPFPGLLS